jgi:hypothetical protein
MVMVGYLYNFTFSFNIRLRGWKNEPWKNEPWIIGGRFSFAFAIEEAAEEDMTTYFLFPCLTTSTFSGLYIPPSNFFSLAFSVEEEGLTTAFFCWLSAPPSNVFSLAFSFEEEGLTTPSFCWSIILIITGCGVVVEDMIFPIESMIDQTEEENHRRNLWMGLGTDD